MEVVKTTERWQLGNVAFDCQGVVASLMCDTGAGVTSVSLALVKKAKLEMRELPADRRRPVRLPNGTTLEPVGLVDVPMCVQLMLEEERIGYVHWDRQFTLKDVWVLDLGDLPPRDMYVAWADFQFKPGHPAPQAPLGHLAYMVCSGARVLNTPRAPVSGASSEAYEVVALRRSVASASAKVAAAGDAGPVVAGLPVEATLRDRIVARLTEAKRSSAVGVRLVAALLERSRVFTDVVSAECTEVVDFELVGTPKEVTFRVNAQRKVPLSVYEEQLSDWVRRGVAERVSHSTPAYGFAMVVPKPNGKFRLTINPSGINSVTARISPVGGFMPKDIINTAQTVGRRTVAVKLDMREAFTIIKLAETAQRLSTFTTPVGKYRWKQGYFGWHSFPALFQKLIMEKVVLPTLDEFGYDALTILAWIDDLIIAADDEESLVAATLSAIDRILAIGGRLSIDKCEFFVTRFDWCGVEVDLPTNQWRVAPERVSSLMETPVPKDRVTLQHVLGILRYYWHAVDDHNAQRSRIAKLVELDVVGARVADLWTDDHSRAMYDALRAVSAGRWLLVFDPSQPVTVTTDASGSHGYCVTAYQTDSVTGELRPIAFISRGWAATQLRWTAQVKECYAQMQAVTKVMPAYFPYARVCLLCDNQNLAAVADSADARVVRWQNDIRCTGCITRWWKRGEWNTIADYGSRAVVADPDAQLTEEQRFDEHVYALGFEEPTAEVAEGTVVPGHLAIIPMVEKIVLAQEAASAVERATWSGKGYSTATLAGRTLWLFRNRLIVPREASELKTALMRLAHDDTLHFVAAERTLIHLQQQAHVHWVGMQADVQRYVDTCIGCQYAKAATHGPAKLGELNPTIAPYVHHTWYVDLKGPMPHGTGYLMAVVESVTRFVKLRYLRNGTAAEVCEELEEAIISFGTRPVVLRSDGGPPFDSAEYKAFCKQQGILPKPGVAYHSQGQGMVETRFRPIAAAIIATLGHKAPHTWWEGRLLARLEGIINSTYCEPISGSPYWAMYGHEPRTALSAHVDWTSEAFGEEVVGLAAATFNDINEIIAQHHARISAVQGRVLIASSLAQALTKRAWDSTREKGDFAVGEHVLLHRVAPNRMLPHFTGPYVVASVSADGNFVTATHFLDKSTVHGPFHVSRLLHFDASRATPAELAEFQLEPGSYVVDGVIEHRQTADGSYEFHLRWRGTSVTSWQASRDLRQVVVVKDYCSSVGLPPPGTEPRRAASESAAAARGSGRGARARGSGRGAAVGSGSSAVGVTGRGSGRGRGSGVAGAPRGTARGAGRGRGTRGQ
jgi:hypothetical protein